jgi:hypothetical protein
MPDDSSPRTGLSFFQGRRANVLNFVHELDAVWRSAYRGSDMLSWRDKGSNGAVGIFIIGRLGKVNLDCAQSDYNDPSYRVELSYILRRCQL